MGFAVGACEIAHHIEMMDGALDEKRVFYFVAEPSPGSELPIVGGEPCDDVVDAPETSFPQDPAKREHTRCEAIILRYDHRDIRTFHGTVDFPGGIERIGDGFFAKDGHPFPGSQYRRLLVKGRRDDDGAKVCFDLSEGAFDVAEQLLFRKVKKRTCLTEHLFIFVDEGDYFDFIFELREDISDPECSKTARTYHQTSLHTYFSIFMKPVAVGRNRSYPLSPLGLCKQEEKSIQIVPFRSILREDGLGGATFSAAEVERNGPFLLIGQGKPLPV